MLSLKRRVRPGPCRAFLLARQCSPRVACLYHTCISYRPSLYSDIPILLLQTRQDGPRHELRTVFCIATRKINVNRTASWPSGVDGTGLRIIVQQHYGFRMHLELKGAIGSRSFERRLPNYKFLAHFCTTLIDEYL